MKATKLRGEVRQTPLRRAWTKRYFAAPGTSPLGASPHCPCGEIVEIPRLAAEQSLDRALKAIQPSRVRAETRRRAGFVGSQDDGELAVKIPPRIGRLRVSENP